MPSHTHYGWGENANATTGLGFGTSSKNGYYGNNQHDSDNYLYAATFAGGIGTNNIPVTYNDNGTEVSSTTSSSWTDNQAFSVMQKSYAINYFIFGGA
ncbi:hypothetical protein BBL07_15725 [Agrobacterium vitis]|nr:hypothetical protein BBL07_15725 [Agrobacterium vitis]